MFGNIKKDRLGTPYIKKVSQGGFVSQFNMIVVVRHSLQVMPFFLHLVF